MKWKEKSMARKKAEKKHVRGSSARRGPARNAGQKRNPKPAAREPEEPNAKDESAAPGEEDAPPEPKVESRKYTDILRVPLTESELVVKGEEQARLLRTVADMEARQKSDTKHQKAAIDERKAEMGRLAAEICDRATYKPVECERRFDFTTGVVVEVRADTGEVIGSRPMLSSERQRNLPLDAEEIDEEDVDAEDASEDDDEESEGDDEEEDLDEEADRSGRRMSAGARHGRVE